MRCFTHKSYNYHHYHHFKIRNHGQSLIRLKIILTVVLELFIHQYMDLWPYKENINMSTIKGNHLKTEELYSSAGVKESIEGKAFNVTQLDRCEFFL